MRMRDRKPFITESIALPEADVSGPRRSDRKFPMPLRNLPEMLRCTASTRTDERITAARPTPGPRRRSVSPVGRPLLKIDRFAFTLDDRPVEWRVSLCNLKQALLPGRPSERQLHRRLSLAAGPRV